METKPLIELPEYFDTYVVELEAKGYFSDVAVLFAGRRYRITFYDPIRLQQEIVDQLSSGKPEFHEPNLVVVSKIRRDEIERAVFKLADLGFVGFSEDSNKTNP